METRTSTIRAMRASAHPTKINGLLTLFWLTTPPRPVTLMTPSARIACDIPFIISRVGAIRRLLRRLWTTIV